MYLISKGRYKIRLIEFLFIVLILFCLTLLFLISSCAKATCQSLVSFPKLYFSLASSGGSKGDEAQPHSLIPYLRCRGSALSGTRSLSSVQGELLCSVACQHVAEMQSFMPQLVDTRLNQRELQIAAHLPY